MRRIPNLDTAIDYCKQKGLKFDYELCKRADHIKFHIEGIANYLVLGTKKDNRDRVRRDLDKLIGAM